MTYLTSKILHHRAQLDDFDIFPAKIHDFVPTDTEKLLKYHQQIKKEEPSIYYYSKNPIKYDLNSHGFRTSDEFNKKEWGDVYLGCSHTFGIGHHLENTWSYKLNKVLGGKFWNLALPGTGVDTHFRIFLGYYRELKIRNVFHYAPMYPRYEFLENKRPQSYIVGDYNEKWLPKFGSLMAESLLTDEQVEINWHKNTLAVKALAEKVGAKYYLVKGSVGWHGRDDDSLLARDLLHYTTQYQHKVYQDFLQLYDNKIFEKYKDNQQPIQDIKKYMKETYPANKLI